MENLLTLIAESRECLRLYAGQAISDHTAHGYDRVYRRYLAHGRVGLRHDVELATLRWRRSALRHGAVRALRRTLPDLEAAITSGDDAAAAAAEPVRRALDVLHAFPAALPGRPARGIPPDVALAALA